MQYQSDDSNIRSAKDAVDDAKFEIEVAQKEKEIKLIEEEIDLLEEQKDAIQAQIDALDKQSDQIEKYYSTMISETEKYYDSLISSIEKKKSKWEELAEIEGIAQAYSDISQVLGDMGYTVQDILSGNEQVFEDIKSKYLSLLSTINNNSSFAEGLSFAMGVDEEDLDSFLGKTKEIADGISNLSTKTGELSTVAENMGALAGSATTASEGTSTIASNMDQLSTNTEGLFDNLTNINGALSGLPEADNIKAISAAFTEMAKAIKDMVDALGIGEEDPIGSLVGALQSLSELSLGEINEDSQSGGTGIISQFNNLKAAVEGVINAISGGGTSESSGGDASTSLSPSMSFGANIEGTGGLIGALNSIETTAEEALGSAGDENTEDAGSGTIGHFGQLKNAVDKVKKAIGIKDDKDEKDGESTLIDALRAQHDAASEVLPNEKKLFEELLESILACVSALNDMASTLNSISGVETPSENGVSDISVYAKGTVGNTFANGTGNYKGLPKDEKYALRSEYGQPELTIYPDGTTELTTSPVMSHLPKGTVIFNEKQTKQIMNNKPHAKGKAYANGTTEYSDGTIITPDGNVLKPLREGDRDWDLMQKIQPLVDKMLKGETDIMSNAMIDHQKQIEQMVRDITTTNIAANTNNKPSVAIGDIHVTCPGVTEQQVAEKLGGVIGKELDKQFNGFHNYTDQMSRIR